MWRPQHLFMVLFTAHSTEWILMDVDDLEGAIALRNANIQCPPKEVLTGFTFEDNERSSKFRYFSLHKNIQILTDTSTTQTKTRITILTRTRTNVKQKGQPLLRDIP